MQNRKCEITCKNILQLIVSINYSLVLIFSFALYAMYIFCGYFNTLQINCIFISHFTCKASCLSPVKVAGINLKILGGILDRHLTFDKYVSAMAQSCNYHAQVIYHTHHLLTMALAQTLSCTSVILSRINYCNAVFHGTPSGTIHKLQRPAGMEQCHKDHSSSAKTITGSQCTPSAEETALVAFVACLLQAGHADVQDTAYRQPGISQSAHQGTQRHSVTAIIGHFVSRLSMCHLDANGKRYFICNLELCFQLSSAGSGTLHLNLGKKLTCSILLIASLPVLTAHLHYKLLLLLNFTVSHFTFYVPSCLSHPAMSDYCFNVLTTLG